MPIEELYKILRFAEINGMMKWSIFDVINEYETTKEVAKAYEN